MAKKWHNIGEESSYLCAATVGVTKDGYVFPVRCKRWSCPVCAPINAYHEAIKVANGIRAMYTAGLVPKFATITQGPKVKTAEFAYSILDQQWDGFRNRWQYWVAGEQLRSDFIYHPISRRIIPRVYKDAAPTMYAAFVEGQERREGVPHFHIIATMLPKKELMRKWAIKSGFGFEVDIQSVGASSGAAWYVSKYSTKSSDAQIMPKNFRRVRYSQDWPKMLFRSDTQEGEAIVRERGESYEHWALRAVMAFGLAPDDLIYQVSEIMEKTGNEFKTEAAAMAELIMA